VVHIVNRFVYYNLLFTNRYSILNYLAFEANTKIKIYPEELPMNFPVVTIYPVFKIKINLTENEILNPFNLTYM
jgi:hypothetical protein